MQRTTKKRPTLFHNEAFTVWALNTKPASTTTDRDLQKGPTLLKDLYRRESEACCIS